MIHKEGNHDSLLSFARSHFLSLIFLSPPAASLRGDEPKPGVSLTVYNDNFALVKDRRLLEEAFRKGTNIVRFRDVAATIDATSVHFRSLTDPAATVDEQNFEFDLVNADKLLQKYIDKKLTAVTADGRTYEGISDELRSAAIGAGRRSEEGADLHGRAGREHQADPVQRIARGTIDPAHAGLGGPGREGRQTSGRVELHRRQHPLAGRLQPGPRARRKIARPQRLGDDREQHGHGFADAAVKLVAGQPRIDPEQIAWGFGQEYYKQMTRLAPTAEKGKDPSQAFGEYRMYRLPEATAVNNNQIKQVELIAAAKVPVEKTYLYDGAKLQWVRYGQYWDPGYGREENKKVNVMLEFENRADRHLGIALPKGKCRVYKADSDKSLEFIGEDLIEHTPRDEKVTLYIGDAFDIVGERKQTDFKKITDHVYEEAFEIKIRNHKEEPVTVKVLEKLYRWSDWKILEKSHDFEKVDSRTVIFPITVPKDGETTVTYRVRYEW